MPPRLDDIPPPDSPHRLASAVRGLSQFFAATNQPQQLPSGEWAKAIHDASEQPGSYFWRQAMKYRVAVALGLTDGETGTPRRGRRLLFAALLGAGAVAGVGSAYETYERGRIADRQAAERSRLIEAGPAFTARAAHHTLAFGTPQGDRAEFAHEGVIVERNRTDGTHVVISVRHGVSMRGKDGTFVDDLRRPLYTLPTVPHQNTVIQNTFGINAAAPEETRGYVDPAKVIFPRDVRLDAIAIPLAAMHGYKQYISQLNADVASSGYRLRLDLRPPVEGDPLFVMALDRLPVVHTPAAAALCGGASEALGLMTAGLLDATQQRALGVDAKKVTRVQRELDRAIKDVCDPPFRFLRKIDGYVADQAKLKQFPTYASGQAEGVLLGGFDSLPAQSGMPVFSIEGAELRLRGVVKQGGTLAGGLAVMTDSLTLHHELIAPQREMMDTAVRPRQ